VSDGGDRPAQIGRYRIDRILGTGAMGVVYLAHDPAIDRPVALKLIRADLLDDESRSDYIDRFTAEARAVGRFHHPNIVSLYDLSLHDGNPFLVMEYIQGESLYQVIRRSGRFAPAIAVEIMLQVLRALAAAHASGIVHRDVKPANVMIAPGRLVKMMDFGIARFDTSNLTQPGAVIGTPRYMSPEQILGKTVDARGDLFSSGVVLHEMLTGTPPFDGGSMMETMQKILTWEPPDLSIYDSSISSGIAAVLRKALAKDPAERFPDANAMAAALLAGAAAPYDDRTAVARPPVGATPAPGSSAPGSSAPGSSASGSSASGSSASGSSAPGSSAPGSSAPGSSVAALSAEEVTRAERALAVVVGPIAKIMVKRALPMARTGDELWQALSRLIPSEGERAQFLSHRSDRA
jgi:serine/threonine protein kinase